MAEANDEDCQVDVEHALSHVMDIVCRYASGFDLRNVAGVCSSWLYASLREQKIRPCNQQLQLPYKTDDLTNQLDVFPFVSILIYDSKLEKKLSIPEGREASRRYDTISNGLEEELLENFTKQLPYKTIVLMVDKFLTTEEVDVQDPPHQCQLKPPRSYDILGLFLSSLKDRIKIDVTSIAVAELHKVYGKSPYRSALLDRLNDELGFTNRKHIKSAIIMIISWQDYYYAATIIRRLFDGVKEDGENITFGSLIAAKQVSSDSKAEIRDNNNQIITMLRVSGPSTETWSTFIDCCALDKVIDCKLQELKAKVTQKRHYTGLLYTINCIEPGCTHLDHPCGNSHEMMRTLKRVFPFVPFIGNFLDCYPPVDRYREEEFFWNMQLSASVVIIGMD